MSMLHQRYLAALRLSQFAPPEQLASYQRGVIERLIRHAYENVPYYRQRLACVLKNGCFRPSAWSDIPILTRAEVQDRGCQLHAEASTAGASFAGSTTGSTGSPLVFRQSEVAKIASDCQFERMLEIHAIDRTAHLAFIRVDPDAVYPHGREARGWNRTHRTARESLLHVGTPIAEQAQWLLARCPRYLGTYPSNAAALAQTIGSSGADLRLSAVLTLGEHVSEDQREVIASVFGCRIFDTYSTSEIGYLAFECPAGGGYHIAHESVLLELVDEHGRPAPAGALGQVLVTALYNYAMPFIRYAVGDYAVAAVGACSCGRTLPRLARIAGRTRNIFSFADGSQHSPWGWRSAFRDLLSAREMQIVQTATDTVEIRYVPRQDAPPPNIALINDAARRRIHPAVTTRVVAVDCIPRSPSGKVEDCISLVTRSS